MSWKQVGTIRELWRYPVKSMRGESVAQAGVYWYGLDGDRRYAFVQSGNPSVFPWLTGRELPELLRYRPRFSDPDRPHEAPVMVDSPEGRRYQIADPALLQELSRGWHGKELHLMQLNRGASDTGAISLMSLATGRRLAAVHGGAVDLRRFRQNIIVDTSEDRPYIEDGWTGSLLRFGDHPQAVELLVIRTIQRCQMVNIDPETAERSAGVLKTVNRSRDNCVGVYLLPKKIGTLRVGDAVFVEDR